MVGFSEMKTKMVLLTLSYHEDGKIKNFAIYVEETNIDKLLKLIGDNDKIVLTKNIKSNETN